MNSHIPVTTSADKEKVLSVSTQGAGFFLWNVCWLLPMGSQLENTLYSFVTVSKLHPTPPFRVGIRELIKKKLTDDEDGIATTNLKVTVSCPLGEINETQVNFNLIFLFHRENADVYTFQANNL